MQLDRKNPGIGDIVLLKRNGKLFPLLIVYKDKYMKIDGWISGQLRVERTPSIGIKFGNEEGQWRLKE